MLVRHAHPVLPVDFPWTRVKKVGHHGTFCERLFVLLKSLYFHKANSAIAEGMVIAVTMRFLNDHFIPEACHVSRNAYDGLLISHVDAGCRSHHKGRCGAGCDERGLTAQLLRQIG